VYLINLYIALLLFCSSYPLGSKYTEFAPEAGFVVTKSMLYSNLVGSVDLVNLL